MRITELLFSLHSKTAILCSNPNSASNSKTKSKPLSAAQTATSPCPIRTGRFFLCFLEFLGSGCGILHNSAIRRRISGRAALISGTSSGQDAKSTSSSLRRRLNPKTKSPRRTEKAKVARRRTPSPTKTGGPKFRRPTGSVSKIRRSSRCLCSR